MPLIHYGTDATIELPSAASAPECRAPAAAPLADLRAAIREALASPIDFPPLARATTPADQVVLALESGLPRAAEIVAAVVEALIAAPVDPDGITVLQGPAEAGDEMPDPRRMIREPIRQRVALATHEPDDRKKLAYLAADEAGEPILLSRPLHEADLVLPIGCLHPESATGIFGVHGLLFPGFSDRETQKRFRSLRGGNPGNAAKQRLVEQADHVAWLLGIQFTIQVVPGPGDTVLDVLAGQSNSVARRGRELYRDAWDCDVPRPVGLVVAAIRGGPAQQTWENVGRALDAALAVVEDGGAIAVCCELEEPPGPALKRLAGAESRRAALRRIDKERPPDALVAASLARALDRGSVYLLSRLKPEVVEPLDIVHVAAAEELARLARRFESCVLLDDAPRAVVHCQW